MVTKNSPSLLQWMFNMNASHKQDIHEGHSFEIETSDSFGYFLSIGTSEPLFAKGWRFPFALNHDCWKTPFAPAV